MDPQLAAFLAATGLVTDPARATAMPLSGGVASDIWRVDVDGRSIVVKRALAKLRVAQEWRAPVSRNADEAAWLRVAAAIVPGAAPAVLAEADGMFALPWLDPATHPVWKAELAAGWADPAFAACVGRTLGALHAATAGDAALAAAFAAHDKFAAIRLDPYLRAAARRHPDLAAILHSLADRTGATRLALVHGDVSPKNILVGPSGPVLLDAECAVFGDPAFDLAFVLTHLLLKRHLAPQAAADLLACFHALARAYRAAVLWEPVAELEARAASLLPALLLARIDGKSPVEYITDSTSRAQVRTFAAPRLKQPPTTLTEVATDWSAVYAA